MLNNDKKIDGKFYYVVIRHYLTVIKIFEYDCYSKCPECKEQGETMNLNIFNRKKDKLVTETDRLVAEIKKQGHFYDFYWSPSNGMSFEDTQRLVEDILCNKCDMRYAAVPHQETLLDRKMKNYKLSCALDESIDDKSYRYAFISEKYPDIVGSFRHDNNSYYLLFLSTTNKNDFSNDFVRFIEYRHSIETSTITIPHSSYCERSSTSKLIPLYERVKSEYARLQLDKNTAIVKSFLEKLPNNNELKNNLENCPEK